MLPSRYVAIVHPFKYEMWMSVKRVKILIGFSWIIICPIILFYILGLNKAPCGYQYTDAQRLSTIFLIFASLSIIITYTYTGIFLVALKHRSRISPVQVVSSIANSIRQPVSSMSKFVGRCNLCYALNMILIIYVIALLKFGSKYNYKFN